MHHDDAEREYAYGAKSKIGTFSDAQMADATMRGLVMTSMKQDWKRIFPFKSQKESYEELCQLEQANAKKPSLGGHAKTWVEVTTIANPRLASVSRRNLLFRLEMMRRRKT